MKTRGRRKRKKRAGRIVLMVMVTVMILLGAGCAAFYAYPLFLPKVDPFDYVTVSFEGKTGSGVAEVTPLTDLVGADVSRITYTISRETGLTEGEEITVTAKSRSYNLTQKEKTFEVSGLEQPLTAMKQLGEASIAELNSKAAALMQLNMGDPSDAFGVTNELISSEPARMFLLANTDGTNILYHFTKAKFRTSSGEEKLVFLVSYFTNVMYSADNDGQISFDSCNYTGEEVLLGDDVVYDSYITGYPSLKKAKTVLVDEQKTGKTVTSIKMN